MNYDDEQPEFDEPAVPHDTDAERIVLGAMLLNPDVIDEALNVAPVAAYYHWQHVEILEAIAVLRSEGKPTDATAVLGELRKRGTLTKVGGGPYLHRLMQVVPFTGSAAFHAEAVRDAYIKRFGGDTGISLTQMFLDPALDRDDTAEAVHVAIRKLTDVLAAIPGTAVPTAGSMFVDTCDAIEKPPTNLYVPTGVSDLDSVFSGGVMPGQITVVAARPSVGKSLFALGAARHAAIKRKIPTLLTSLEMSGPQIMRRLISAEAGVNLSHITSSQCDDRDWQLIGRVAERILDAPLYIDDAPGLTLARLHQTIRDLKRTAGLRLAVIDYLQLMSPPKAENREQRIAALTRGLKRMAQELEIPIIVLAQLNRESTKRPDKRPTMADLRESGAIENDADNIVLLHREDMYDAESPRTGEVDLIVEKNRDGVRCTITCAMQGHYARIADMAVPDSKWTPHSAMPEAA